MKPELNALLLQWGREAPHWQELGAAVHALLGAALREAGVAVHSVNFRVKDPEHLKEKLGRPEKEYDALHDVTDLLGLRVITYFEDDVDRVAALIDREFSVDAARSVDRRQTQEPDRFGYAAVHKICTLLPRRLEQPGYSAFEGMFFEIQVRSILQHAWAEIEHDLGYKSGQPVPVAVRRRFSRLASLLELADDEFIRVRNDLKHYAAHVESEIATNPANVSINGISLAVFLQFSPLVQAVDEEIAARLHQEPREHSGGAVLGRRAAELDQVGIRTVTDLQHALEAHRGAIVELASRLQWRFFVRGNSTYLLALLLAAREHGLPGLIDLLSLRGDTTEAERKRYAEKVLGYVEGLA